MINKNIDNGKPFDWGRTSQDYAKFRDIYPEKFYEKIVGRNLCTENQSVLDIGTGTGVLPRNLYGYGAKWTGTDISENQIEQAKILSRGMNIDYYTIPAEQMNFPEQSFDVITACQCFWYFDHQKLMPKLYKMLKPGGSLLVLYMAWLPFEDEIAGASEKLVLKYNPGWSGAGERIRPIEIPKAYKEAFTLSYHEEYLVKVPFTRESWHGRMKACRGIGASLTGKEIQFWEEEHRHLLEKIAPEQFEIRHYGAMAELKKSEKGSEGR
ncbi:MAG: class I SAM-dependent methyltransferase [Ruminococcus sp.]|jgi:ubiquinone/menaquinone biosynthesis C-methylase UbiE